MRLASLTIFIPRPSFDPAFNQQPPRSLATPIIAQELVHSASSLKPAWIKEISHFGSKSLGASAESEGLGSIGHFGGNIRRSPI
jgi:hypothetical protein